MEGWVKLHRELLDKPIWLLSTPEHKAILVAILLMVNHEEKTWEWKGQTFTCKPGQIITSLEGIRRIAGKGVSVQNIRSALLRFEKLNFLTSESTMLNRLITVCNWEYYQSFQQCDQQSTQQSTNKAPTTNKNDKNNIILSSNEESAKSETPKKRSRKKKEKPEGVEEAPTLFTQARKIFEARYHRETRAQYYWTAKDAGNMTSLLNALKFQREQKGLSNEDDTEVLAALSAFLNCAVKDDWIRKNLAVAVLFSKFNEIVARAKDEEQQRKNRNNGTGTTTGKDSDNGAIAQPSEATPKDYSTRF